MTPVIAPDIGQSIMVSVYLLFSHNYEAIAYFTGMVIGIILLIWKPSRLAVIVMLGFAILLFSYEYDKHIITAFREQTLTSLATAKPHLRFQRLISIVISDLLPIVFYVTGWALVFISIIYSALKMHWRPR